mgnify:CR=1 FL=1
MDVELLLGSDHQICLFQDYVCLSAISNPATPLQSSVTVEPKGQNHFVAEVADC